ncbi:HSP20 family protein [Dehalogenimonas formicexedens]|uniref:HSP20 family protein n=1 Tax=Dehalogenimonas formicexedens TaxID=1839801 RepID=A0A1P8F974_9CHLR|nr:Hsp20/alpha crystallin family protein [Dehalogenimonas formicexedens]APV45019.1 HSP20 family protein [Dehalogenimonas formicexedens]
MVLQRWDPYRELRQVDRTFDRMWRNFGLQPATVEQWDIPIDVKKVGDEIVVKASLPGVKADEIQVTVEDNVLELKAESSSDTETEESGYLVRERAFGSFYRALRLPESVDTEHIRSTYEHGVLTVTLPKAEEKKRKQIKVSVQSGGKVIETAEKK